MLSEPQEVVDMRSTQGGTVAERCRNRRFVILVVLLLVALRTGFGQAPPLPKGTTTIYGDKSTAPRQAYAVHLVPGSTLDVRLSGGSGTSGLYDLSLYALSDGSMNFSPANCITRAYAEVAPQTADQGETTSGCGPRAVNANNPGKASAPKKAPKKLQSPTGSDAHIKYVAASSSPIYYIVVQFYGVGMQVKLTANVKAPVT
jgi:hypothetical protein